jgi:hypothetical protein
VNFEPLPGMVMAPPMGVYLWRDAEQLGESTDTEDAGRAGLSGCHTRGYRTGERPELRTNRGRLGPWRSRRPWSLSCDG